MKQLNRENIRQFLIYLVVGGLATIVEWVVFYLLDARLKMHYAPATALAFVLSTFANWGFGRLLLFKNVEKKSLWAELSAIYLTSLIGLALNLLIMWIGVDLIHLPEMLSKIGATGIVFFWNFFIRKLLIYKI